MAIAMKKRLDYIEQAQVEAENALNAELLRGGFSMALEMANDVLSSRRDELEKEEGVLKEKERGIESIKVWMLTHTQKTHTHTQNQHYMIIFLSLDYISRMQKQT